MYWNKLFILLQIWIYNELIVQLYVTIYLLNLYIDGLMQERRNSIANALELRLSGTNPLILEKEFIFYRNQCRNIIKLSARNNLVWS